jgi:branched-chain amino acid transport system permease protein
MSVAVQIILNTLLAGAGYVLLSLGFNLLYKAVKFFDISYGVLVTIGGYAMFFFWQKLGWSFAIAFVASLALTVAVALIFNALVYKPLRGKWKSDLIPLLASLGIYTLVTAVIALLFSSQYQLLVPGSVTVFSIFGGYLTSVHLITIACAVLASISILTLLYKNSYGRALRAIDDDVTVSEIVGIPVQKVTRITIVIAALCAGLSGILIGSDTGLLPTMGMSLLLKAVIAVVVGGLGSIEGGIISALLLAVAENAAVYIWSAQWRDPVAFAVLILILLIRPKGIWSKK